MQLLLNHSIEFHETLLITRKLCVLFIEYFAIYNVYHYSDVLLELGFVRFVSIVFHFSLKALDLVTMKKLDNKVNIIPVIAKADTITKAELQKFKQKVRSWLDLHTTISCQNDSGWIKLTQMQILK